METLIDGQIACVWAITFNDPEIWKNEIRMPQYTFIALQQTLTLEAIIGILVEWAKEYARSIEKDFVRLDTLGIISNLLNIIPMLALIFWDIRFTIHSGIACTLSNDQRLLFV
jgi:hypothetical protein